MPETSDTAVPTPVEPARTVCALHGIRTHADWQRAFSEIATREGWNCDQDRWYYGQFSIFHFLSPWGRAAKLRWFRETYYKLMQDRNYSISPANPPSIVAHSFGTYIVGNALLRYETFRFNKVILCGSILPPNFPWATIIQRGQVQELRNEHGVLDPWVKRVCWFVPGTGPSGSVGFTADTAHLPDLGRLVQESFQYDHSDYFDKTHIRDYWLPFLSRKVAIRPLTTQKVDPPATPNPWGLYVIYALLAAGLGLAVFWVISLVRPPRKPFAADYVPYTGPHYASNVLHDRYAPNDPDDKKLRVMMNKWMEWMDSRPLATEEAKDGKPPKLLEQFLVVRSDPFAADYATFRLKIQFRDSILLDEGAAFLVHDEGVGTNLRPVYRQLKLTGASHPLDPNALTVIEANKGEQLLLFLRVRANQADLPEKPAGYHLELRVQQ